jgi:hypothetical protein
MARTVAQIDASRRNGAKSRGPVTAAGRLNSSRNALKHGFRAAETENTIEEHNREEYEKLRRAYLEEYRPQGPTESTLLDVVIHAAWQLYRIREKEARSPIEFGVLGSFGPSERLARYRASFERSMFKAMKELAAVQEERRLREAPYQRLQPTVLPPRVSSQKYSDRIRNYDTRLFYGDTPPNPASFCAPEGPPARPAGGPPNEPPNEPDPSRANRGLHPKSVEPSS